MARPMVTGSFGESRAAVAPEARRLLIVGSLENAADALRALKGSQQWVPVGILSPVAAGIVVGFGVDGYVLAIDGLLKKARLPRPA